MLFKWIHCSVSPRRQAAFHSAQQAWDALSSVDGCQGQAGGWDRSTPPRAGILGVWRDGASYLSFMSTVHDRITAGSHQAAHYEACETMVCELVLTIPGVRSELLVGLPDAGVLRVADCQLKAGRLDHFLDMQAALWNPAMAEAGMLCGAVGRAAGSPQRYVVVSLWRDADQHDAYACGVDKRRARAAVEADIETLQGSVVLLEPSWNVPANTT